MNDTEREITGRTVLFIALTAFGIVFSANMTLAWFATGTFPGLEVKNSYIASQHFDDLREAQEALGWQTRTLYDSGELRVGLVASDGLHAHAETVQIRIGRPATSTEDLHFSYTDLRSDATMPLVLAKGQWRVDVEAQALDGTRYVTREVIWVDG